MPLPKPLPIPTPLPMPFLLTLLFGKDIEDRGMKVVEGRGMVGLEDDGKDHGWAQELWISIIIEK